MKQIFGKGIKIKRIACCCQFFKSPRESWRVRELLNRYVDFDFSIDLKAKKVSFSREITKEGKSEKKALESLVFPTPL
jgi:hypothetical protein